MKLFTHCAHIEMEKAIESAYIEIERDMEKSFTYKILLEAAILGTPTKMAGLWRLLQDDPAILDRAMWEYCRGKDNPLHVGVLYGNVNFVREILNRKRELTRELNSEGQSLLHLASASGHVEVVKEILSKDADACFIRDRDGMIPLHLAAINGQVEVLEELVRAEKITAFILTKSGEPILHLCAKYNEFTALKKLIELVKDDRGFVNWRDRNGDTILHLLAAKEKLEVIKFLVEKPEVEVNAKNTSGLTPLDVLLETGTKIHGWKIHRLLVSRGAKSSSERKNNSLVRLMGPLIMSLDGNDGNWFIESLMVVAVLMVSVAFQARLNPPGGVWQDTGFHNATFSSNDSSLSFKPPVGFGPSSSSPKLVPHVAGQSIMSYVDSGRYNLFAFFNDFTLSSSMLVIQVLLIRRFFNLRILTIVAIFLTSVSVVALSVTYVVSMAFISSDEKSTRTYLFVYPLSTILYLTFGVWLGSRLRSCMLGTEE